MTFGSPEKEVIKKSLNMSSITKKIEQIENQLAKLKLMLEAKNTKSEERSDLRLVEKKTKKNLGFISDCKKKSELEKFTVKDLKAFIKENKIDIKKITEKHKIDLVKIIWKTIKKSLKSEDESETSENSSSDSDES